MKTIKINRLTLENFKCHSLLNLVLEGRDTSVYGDNATGKTSIYDALTWLLFGKDSLGNGEKNIDIKPLDAKGEVKDHEAITSVEVEFDVDGEVTTFKRTYREVWATRRGTSAVVYEGNTSDYFVGGVPMKKNAYDEAIREIIPEELFRMLTSVSYFAADMKWQYRRAVLFDMAGTMTDKTVMAMEPRFDPLAESLGKYTLAEFKAKLAHEKKGLTNIRDDTPTRINECQRTLHSIADINFAEARAYEERLLQKQADIQGQLMKLDQDSVLEGKRLDLRAAKLDYDNLESRNRAHRDSQRRSGPDTRYLCNEISREKARVESCRSYLIGSEASLARYDREIQGKREEYVRVNGEAFAGGICPTCGQTLPFEQLQEATRVFNLKKEERLANISQQAENLKNEQFVAQSRIEEIKAEIAQREENIAKLEEELRQAQSMTVKVTDLEEYEAGIAELSAKIRGLQDEISALCADSSQVREALHSDLVITQDNLRSVRGMIAKEAIREQTEKRIQELTEDARNAAAALERIEEMLFLMEEFTRFKAKHAEASVNDMFRLAAFRLFREQANGGLEERCDAMHDGVPFMGLNNGMKVNVGIDIINALSRHYGVTVPLFVDNAEAVTRLEPCGAQVIRLVVSEEDKELRIV